MKQEQKEPRDDRRWGEEGESEVKDNEREGRQKGMKNEEGEGMERGSDEGRE